jgi:hypothetical protein
MMSITFMRNSKKNVTFKAFKVNHECFVELNLSNLSVTRTDLWVKIIDFEISMHDFW